jgi:hypothetical protein
LIQAGFAESATAFATTTRRSPSERVRAIGLGLTRGAHDVDKLNRMIPEILLHDLGVSAVDSKYDLLHLIRSNGESDDTPSQQGTI